MRHNCAQYLARDVDALDGAAHLAAVGEREVDRVLGGGVQIGVAHHHHRVFPAALEHHPNLLASRLWQEGAAAVAEFVQILDEHRKTCEREGKYIEADIAKKRLAELRQHEENRRQEGLRSRQIAQRLGVEEAHMLEFQQARPA